jgi:hypothetical protein
MCIGFKDSFMRTGNILADKGKGEKNEDHRCASAFLCGAVF